MSSTYSHSWHMNQSVSVHWSASSWLMWSSSLHPQHDTNTVLVSLVSSILVISLFILFISLFFLSLTEDSIAQFQKIASIKVTFLKKSFFISDITWHGSTLKSITFLIFEVVSYWLSKTYDLGAGARGPKSLRHSDLRPYFLKKNKNAPPREKYKARRGALLVMR